MQAQIKIAMTTAAMLCLASAMPAFFARSNVHASALQAQLAGVSAARTKTEDLKLQPTVDRCAQLLFSMHCGGAREWRHAKREL